jgi:dolichol kinase
VCVCVCVCVFVFVFINFLGRKCFSTNNKSVEGALHFFVWLFFFCWEGVGVRVCVFSLLAKVCLWT